MRPPGPPRHKPLRDREWLHDRYVKQGKSTTQIAVEIGASPRVVNTWLHFHEIETRGTGAEKGHSRHSEASREKLSQAKRGKLLGDKNPNWRGGRTHDPDRNRYPAKQWAKKVKERDGFQCVECGATEDLHAHHIKRWLDYPDLRYDLDNGKTLCSPCHERAHGRGFKFRWHNKHKAPRAHRPSHEGEDIV